MNIEATKLELIKLIADEQSERLLEQVRAFFRKEAKQQKTKAANPENGKAKTANKAGNGNSNSTNQDAEKPEGKRKFISEAELLELAKIPTPVSIDIEQLANEQNYDGRRLEELMKNWDFSLFEDQSLKELLDSLTP